MSDSEDQLVYTRMLEGMKAYRLSANAFCERIALINGGTIALVLPGVLNPAFHAASS